MSERSVLITGASTGIGEACALYLDARGFRVLAGVRKPEDADMLKSRASGRLRPFFIDVTDADSIESARKTLALEHLDGLVNNAGITVAGPLEFVPIADVRRQLEVNVIGQVAVTQAFLAPLRRARGRIVNMSSVSGRVAAPLLGPYAMSKFALEAFSDSLRRELDPFGVRVACIEPGSIATPIWEKSLTAAKRRAEDFPEEARELYGGSLEAAQSTVSRIAENATPAEQVAAVVHQALTAAKPKTRYVVGRDARLGAMLAQFFPDSWIDALMRKRFR